LEESISIQLGRYLDTAGDAIALDTPGTTVFAYPHFPTVVWLAAMVRIPLGENPAYRPQITATLVDAEGHPTMRQGAKTWTPRTGWYEEETTALIYGLVSATVHAPGEYVVIAHLNDQEAVRLPIQVTQGR
jgi:hypothetical protein